MAVAATGEVYLAEDLNLNRKVALKFLPDAFTGDPEKRLASSARPAYIYVVLNGFENLTELIEVP